MENYNTIFTRSTTAHATSRAILVGQKSGCVPQEHKCSIPSCGDNVFRDHFCWEHYQIENYTGR